MNIIAFVAWLTQAEPKAAYFPKYCPEPPRYEVFIQCNHINAREFPNYRDV